MTQHLCLTCGGALTNENGAWSCKYCGNVYEDDSVQRDADMMRALLDEYKIEQVANLRRNLYDAINAKYIDSEQICSICTRIKEYLPDDFMANFYYIANCGNQKETAEYITYINAEDNIVYIEGILKFLLRSFCSEYHLPISGLIERAYRKTDLEKFEHYSTLLSEEAEKEDLGVYETRMPRDVFVAYSSKDMESVYSLVAYLEASGLKCFVAARNLRHGQGARQNYDAALREAILNCESVVFVSSPNSRSFSCDAIKKELPFIKQNDINNAPYEFKQNYASMPYTYKMPRVEYRLSESRTPNAADSVVKEFFESCEFAYTPEEVGMRLISLLEEKKNRHLNVEAPAAPAAAVAESSEKKFCAECGTENPINSKFCGECGGREFVASKAAYEELKTRKKRAEQEKLEREAQQRKLDEQQRQIDEARRKAEEERRKAEAERRKAEAERKKAEEEKQRQTTSNPYYSSRQTSSQSPYQTSGTSSRNYSTGTTSSSYTSPKITIVNETPKPKRKTGGIKKYFIIIFILGIISSVSSLIMRNIGNPSDDPSNSIDDMTELVGSPISTADQLKALANTKGDYYLDADIDLNGAEWTPIAGFEGVFNGNNHTISNFKITKGNSNVGLFSEMVGSVMNLNITDAEITLSNSGENVGILCGTSNGLLNNVSVSGSIDAPSFENVGGIAGRISNNEGYEKLELVDLKSSAQITGEACVGGIAGKYERDTSWYIENHFRNLSNEETVVANKDYAGGIFGYIDTDLGYLYADSLKNTGRIEGKSKVGGIFGFAKTEAIPSYIKNSSNASEIKAESTCGTIAGELICVHIENCRNESSSIEATGYTLIDGERYAMVGGFVGKGTYALNCTNTVSINYEGEGNYVGGIMGYSMFGKGTETKIEGLKNTASISGASYVGGIFGHFHNDCGWYVPTYHSSYENSGEINGSGDYVGGIFGYLNADQGYAYIDGAKNSGNVSGKTYVGGIVGRGISQLVECYIQNSSSSSEITAEAMCGGIAGGVDFIFIKDCTNDGSSITASGYILDNGEKKVYLGGYVGKGFYASNCTNKVNLNYEGEGNYVGGIMGCAHFKSDADISIENLKNEGDINGAGYVGGIIGCYYRDSGWYRVNQFDVIENSGRISGSGNYVGGCIGYIDPTLGYLYIDAASNKAEVSGNENCGDIIGFATAKTDGCYINGSTTAGGNICGKAEGIEIK